MNEPGLEAKAEKYVNAIFKDLTLRGFLPDLVTPDITMPNRSGLRVYRDIKENDRLRSIPVVVVTGVQHEFKEFISTRSQVPVPDANLEKPVDLAVLLSEVRRLLP